MIQLEIESIFFTQNLFIVCKRVHLIPHLETFLIPLTLFSIHFYPFVHLFFYPSFDLAFRLLFWESFRSCCFLGWWWLWWWRSYHRLFCPGLALSPAPFPVSYLSWQLVWIFLRRVLDNQRKFSSSFSSVWTPFKQTLIPLASSVSSVFFNLSKLFASFHRLANQKSYSSSNCHSSLHSPRRR